MEAAMKRASRIFCICLLALALLGGTFLRAWHVGKRGFWRDEAWVADTVSHRHLGDLVTQTEAPLPPLFAVCVKVLGQVVGPPELGLRLLPLGCGLLVPLLAYFAARAARAPRMLAIAGATLCAFSLALVIWSRELKQYAVEAFIATLAAWLVFGLANWRGWRGTAGVAALLLLCVVGPWLGYSAVFALASVLIGLALLPAARRRGRVLLALGAFGVLVISTLAVLHVAAAEQRLNPALLQFWQHWYIDLTSPRSVARAGYWAAFSTTQMIVPIEWFTDVHSLCLLLSAAPVWMLACYGVWRWPRRSRVPMACWTFGPWVLMAAAAVAHRYPFVMQRMVIYTAPPLLIGFAAGTVNVIRLCSAVVFGRHGPGLVAGALIGFLPALYVWNVPCHGRFWWCDDYPALLAALEQRRRPGEPVWVTQEASSPARYYAGARFQPEAYRTSGSISGQRCTPRSTAPAGIGSLPPRPLRHIAPRCSVGFASRATSWNSWANSAIRTGSKDPSCCKQLACS
jgi:hypothetical protein